MSTLEDAVVIALSRLETKARIGLIIPSSNRMTEAQFHRYAPAGIGVHVARVQMTGRHKRPIAQLLDDVGRAASSLGDCRCDPVVFHCTGTAMAEGTEGEAALVAARRQGQRSAGILRRAGDRGGARIHGHAPRRAVQPLRAGHQRSREGILRRARHRRGQATWRSDLPPSDELHPRASDTMDRARSRARARARPTASSSSCTNTTQIEAIETIERETGKPVVNSNQAMLWACLMRIGGADGALRIPGVGRPIVRADREPATRSDAC